MDQGHDQQILTRFGNRVKQLRNATGMSVRDFANHAGIDYTNLSSIENGQVNLTLLTIMQLSEGFGVPPTALFTDEDTSQLSIKSTK